MIKLPTLWFIQFWRTIKLKGWGLSQVWDSSYNKIMCYFVYEIWHRKLIHKPVCWLTSLIYLHAIRLVRDHTVWKWRAKALTRLHSWQPSQILNVLLFFLLAYVILLLSHFVWTDCLALKLYSMDLKELKRKLFRKFTRKKSHNMKQS